MSRTSRFGFSFNRKAILGSVNWERVHTVATFSDGCSTKWSKGIPWCIYTARHLECEIDVGFCIIS